MSETEWYYNVADGTVSQGKEASALDRIGPFVSKEAAQHALETIKARNAAADSADADWND